MNSRRLSQRIGLEANDQAALQELANHLSGGKVSDLDRPESESESEDEEGTTADQAEVRSDEERSNELPTLALGTKATRAPSFIQDAPPP